MDKSLHNLFTILVSLLILVSCVPAAEESELDFEDKLGSSLGNFSGIALYEKNCASCHNALEDSEKVGTSDDQIAAAILEVPEMNHLSSLTEEDITSIYEVLKLNVVKGNPEVEKLCVDPEAVAETDAKFLNAKELENVFRDLFGSDATDVVKSDLSGLTAAGNSEFDTENGELSPIFFKSFIRIVDSLKSGAAKTMMSTSCIGRSDKKSELSNNCKTNIVENWGLKILRRPLLASEKSTFLGILNDISDDDLKKNLEYLVKVFLLHPDFLFRFEDGGEMQDGKMSLTQYERAQKLSFAIWRSMPDEELFEAAENNKLNSESDLSYHISRMFKSNKAKEVILDFYKQWLHMDKFVSESYTDHFLNPTLSKADQMNIYKDALLESERFLRHVTFDDSGKFEDLLNSNWTDLDGLEKVADIYGTNSSETELEGSRRSGILTRAATHITGSNWQHPMSLGAFIRRNILCDELPAPPDDFDLPEVGEVHKGEVLSTRKSFEKAVSSPQCIGCHNQINGLAFAFSNYDSLGRYQEREKIYDVKGAFVATAKVDSVTRPNIYNGSGTTVKGGVALSKMISETPKAKQCFAKKFIRFALGREIQKADGCSIDKFYESIKEQKSLMNVMKEYVENDSFFYKKVKVD